MFEASFVRRMVFVGLASDVFSCQSARLVVLTEPATDIFWSSILLGSWSLLSWTCTDTILDFQFATLPVYAGPAAAMSCSFLSSRVLNE